MKGRGEVERSKEEGKRKGGWMDEGGGEVERGRGTG